MKRVIFCLLLAMIFAPSIVWAVDCNVADEGELSDAADGTTPGCTNVIVTDDISLENPIMIDQPDLNFYGESGSEVISGNLGNLPLMAVGADNVIIHDLVFKNEADGTTTSEILVADLTSGHEFYDIEFQSCSVSCIRVLEIGEGNFYQNTFTDTSASKAIVYTTQTVDAASFVSATLSSLTAWNLVVSTPGGATGSVDIYRSSGGNLTSISYSQNQSGNSTKSFNLSSRLPSGTYYAVFTETTTSTFGSSFSIDWTDETNFSFGDYSACNTSWFTDSSNGLTTGDYDGDGIVNGNEDLDDDCTVDDDETSPALADTDEDGYCDGSTAVSGDESCTASDNCPLVANAGQEDADSDGTGNACDDDYVANGAPVAPTLLSPDHGASITGDSVEVRWSTTTDPDEDELSYHVYLCTDENFEGCDDAIHSTSVNVVMKDWKRFDDPSSPLFMMIGALALGGLFGRRKRILMALLIMAAAFSIASCGGGGGSDDSDTSMSHTITGLESDTTYYWRVAATDTSSNSTPSETRSFVTN